MYLIITHLRKLIGNEEKNHLYDNHEDILI